MTFPTFRSRRLFTLAAGAAALLSAFSSPAFAAWPEAGKTIRIIVGFPPGGGADVLARTVSQALSEKLGTTVIVESKPGAGGLTATDLVAKSAPDGYTLYIATPGSFTIWPSLRKLPYDAAKDFSAISVLVTMPNLLLVGPNQPYKDVKELVAAAKTAGSDLNYASGGLGTIGQIAAEQFNTMAGLRMSHVPYKGTTPALQDVMAGMVPLTFSDPSAKALVDGGKLKLLAVTTKTRSRLFPNTPTMAESGVPGYDVMNWYGLVAPAGTLPEAVQKLSGALASIMAQADIRQRLEAAGMEAKSSTPAEFTQHMAGERAKWAALIAKVGMKAE